MEEWLKDHPFRVEIPVAWGEMDSFQHVNNIIFFRYFETARARFFEKIELFESAKKGFAGPILAQTSCKFRAPLTYPDTITVGVRVKELTSEGFVHEYLIWSEKLKKIAAEGEGRIVAFDYQKGKRGVFSETVLEAIRSLEKPDRHEQTR